MRSKYPDLYQEKLGLSDLIDQNLSAAEYYATLPRDIQQKLLQEDVGTFEEMQERAAQMQTAIE